MSNRRFGSGLAGLPSIDKSRARALPRYGHISRTCPGERTGEILVNEALEMIAAAPR